MAGGCLISQSFRISSANDTTIVTMASISAIVGFEPGTARGTLLKPVVDSFELVIKQGYVTLGLGQLTAQFWYAWLWLSGRLFEFPPGHCYAWIASGAIGFPAASIGTCLSLSKSYCFVG